MRTNEHDMSRRFLWRSFRQPTLVVAFLLSLSAAVPAAPLASRLVPPPVPAEVPDLYSSQAESVGRVFPALLAQGSSPDDRRRMQRQYQEWQALPPEQKDALRRRMEDMKRMPPQDRDRYQQRYRQWEQLPPDERRRIENDLKRWDRLSPQEKDSIQKRFKP
jgi:hypothetical protein